MDPAVLQHALTEDERRHFDKLGYLIVRDVLPPGYVREFAAFADDVFARKVVGGHDASMPVIYHEWLYDGARLRELIDWPRTFPKVFGILGWNIWIYHCHLIVTPPDASASATYPTLGWHQDSGRVNAEMDGGSPRPRLSLKCSFFLSDCSREGMGNFCVLPGSHLQDAIERPESGMPEGAVQVCVNPGDAVLFDRRTWHAASPNRSDVWRKVLTLGYGYRWIWRKDNTDLSPLAHGETPIRAQLLGAGSNQSRYGGHDDEVPLRGWLQEHDPETAAR